MVGTRSDWKEELRAWAFNADPAENRWTVMARYR
jgi:hypothetical protein